MRWAQLFLLVVLLSHCTQFGSSVFNGSICCSGLASVPCLCIRECNKTIVNRFAAQWPPDQFELSYRGIVESFNQAGNFYCFNISVYGNGARFRPLNTNFHFPVPLHTESIAVQYAEKNVAGNVFDAVMNIPVELGRTKVTLPSHLNQPRTSASVSPLTFSSFAVSLHHRRVAPLGMNTNAIPLR